MPSVSTQRFGDLEYQETSTVLFPSGLPGFEQCRRFVLINQQALEPITFLQSLESPELCFLTIPVQVIDPNYRSTLSEEDEAVLKSQERVWLAILAPAENGLTANLVAPLVINPRTRVGVQAIRTDQLYSHCHPLVETAPCS